MLWLEILPTYGIAVSRRLELDLRDHQYLAVSPLSFPSFHLYLQYRCGLLVTIYIPSPKTPFDQARGSYVDSNLCGVDSPDTSLLLSSYRISNCVVFWMRVSDPIGCMCVPCAFLSCKMNSSLLLSPPATTDASWLFWWVLRSCVLGVQSFLLVPAWVKGAVVGCEEPMLAKSLGKSFARGMRHIGRQAQIMAMFSSIIVHIVAPISSFYS